MLIFFRKFARNENKKKNARAHTLPDRHSQACVSAGHAFLKLLGSRSSDDNPKPLRSPELLKLLMPLKPFLVTAIFLRCPSKNKKDPP